MDVRLSKRRETLKGREARRAAARGAAKSRTRLGGCTAAMNG